MPLFNQGRAHRTEPFDQVGVAYVTGLAIAVRRIRLTPNLMLMDDGGDGGGKQDERSVQRPLSDTAI